jgi:topoisomerase IA-like protein
MDEMLVAMNQTKGGLSAKIMAALGDKLIDKKKIQYDKQKVGFSVNIKAGTRNLSVEDDDTKTEIATGSVVPLMIEIKHN